MQEQLSSPQMSSLIQKETRTAALFIHVIAQRMNIQFTDIRCLNHLLNVQSATAGEIAEITGLTTGAVTAMIDRLTKENFVKRTADKDDRRKIIITLKDDNFHKSNIANIFFTQDVINLLSTYSKEEQNTIAKWNEEMTILLQKKIEKLNTAK